MGAGAPTTMTATDHERATLAAVSEISRTSNAADAQLIRQITRYIDSRCNYVASAPGARFDPVTAERSAIAELALALSSSYQAVAGLSRLGLALTHIPVVSSTFDAGHIPLVKVRTIVEHTRSATRKALARLDKSIADAALRLAPTPLGVEIDRLLIEDDATWAERARKEAEATAKVRTKRRPHGMAVLSVTMSAEQVTAVTTLIAEVAKTVCSADPRTTDELCVDAFLAITQGNRTLACRCTREECRARTNPEPAPPQVRLNIMCGLETLLGLADNPGYLPGYGYLGPQALRAGRYPHPPRPGPSPRTPPGRRCSIAPPRLSNDCAGRRGARAMPGRRTTPLPMTTTTESVLVTAAMTRSVT